MSKAPETCLYCDGEGNGPGAPCGFCFEGEPLDTQEDWDRTWAQLFARRRQRPAPPPITTPTETDEARERVSVRLTDEDGTDYEQGWTHRPITTTTEDRSAGRWCETCQQHGGHHTDRHQPLTTTTSTGNAE